MTTPVVLITGALTGIGRATTLAWCVVKPRSKFGSNLLFCSPHPVQSRFGNDIAASMLSGSIESVSTVGAPHNGQYEHLI